MLAKFDTILTVMIGCVLLSGCGGSSSSSSNSSAGHLFVTTEGDTSVSAVQLDPGNGNLGKDSSKARTGSTPSAVIVTPAGDAVFVANNQCANGNSNCNTLSRYNLSPDGTLKPVTAPQGVGLKPVALVVNRAGTLLFVANQGSDSISVFNIQPGAALTQVSNSPFATGMGPVSLVVAPSGRFLYVANSLLGGVSVHAIDSSGGLTPLLRSPFFGKNATQPAGVSVTPDGKFVFVSNAGSNNVSAFVACIDVSSICPIADGSLVEVAGSPFLSSDGPAPLAVDPTGSFLYVVETRSNQIAGYRITDSGALTPTVQATVSTDPGPVALVIHPGGQWLYTANIKASTVSGFGIDLASGQLVPQTPVPTAGQPSALASQ